MQYGCSIYWRSPPLDGRRRGPITPSTKSRTMEISLSFSLSIFLSLFFFFCWYSYFLDLKLHFVFSGVKIHPHIAVWDSVKRFFLFFESAISTVLPVEWTNTSAGRLNITVVIERHRRGSIFQLYISWIDNWIVDGGYNWIAVKAPMI